MIDFYKPYVVALVETYACMVEGPGEKEIGVEGCRWFGRNRRSLHA